MIWLIIILINIAIMFITVGAVPACLMALAVGIWLYYAAKRNS